MNQSPSTYVHALSPVKYTSRSQHGLCSQSDKLTITNQVNTKSKVKKNTTESKSIQKPVRKSTRATIVKNE